MYRIGYPFWRVLGRHGVPLSILVDVLHDKEAGVFVATSDNLRGLVCEAATLDELAKEVTNSIDELVKLQINNNNVPKPVPDLRLLAA